MVETDSAPDAGRPDESDGLKAVMIFSAPLVRKMSADQVRLPPNYVGVRRVRASSKVVWNALRSSNQPDDKRNEGGEDGPRRAPVVYKVTDASGVDRRMTRQEKKELKLKVRKELMEAKNNKKRMLSSSPIDLASSDEKKAVAETSLPKLLPSSSASLKPQPCAESATQLAQKQKRDYHQLKVSSSALEEELAELRGERDGVAPVVLSPPMAQQALHIGVLPSRGEGTNSLSKEPRMIGAEVDDDLAQQWADTLKMSMKSAEDVRSSESIRPMAYQLVPEVWTRMRQPFIAKNNVRDRDSSDGNAARLDTSVSSESRPRHPWSFVSIRQRMEPFDTDASIVYDFLYRRTNLHIACGAKFGCDFLLYDGRRDERHAFAGLRICSQADKTALPLPTAYDLAGYVRCLNTAGKLALLAVVQQSPAFENGDESSVRLAFVDLALEKILSAPTHQKRRSRSSKKARREVGENLTKK